MLAGIIGRHFEQGAAEFDAMADDQIEAVVRIASRDLVYLRDADVLRVGRFEAVSRLEFLQAIVGELAPAAIRNHSGEQQSDTDLTSRVRPRSWNR